MIYVFLSLALLSSEVKAILRKLTRITTKYTLVISKPSIEARASGQASSCSLCKHCVSIVIMEVSTVHFRFTYGSGSNNDIIISMN